MVIQQSFKYDHQLDIDFNGKRQLDIMQEIYFGIKNGKTGN